MGLQKNVVDLVLVGGQDDKVDPRLAVKPRELVNTRYALDGSLSKRYGSDALTRSTGLQNTRLYSNRDQRKIFGTELQRVAKLVSTQGELLRASRGALDRVLDPDLVPTGAGPLSPIDTLPNYHVDRTIASQATTKVGHLAAYGLIAASLTLDQFAATQVATYARDTMAPIASYFTFGDQIKEARLVLAPYQHTLADPVRITPIVYYRNASFELRVVPLRLGEAPSVSYLIAAEVETFDVTPALIDSGTGLGIDTSWLTWNTRSLSVGVNRASLARVRVAQGAAVLGTPVTFGGVDPRPQYLALDTHEASTRVHVAYGYTAAFVATVKGYAFDPSPTPTLAWGPTTFDAAIDGTLRGAIAVISRGASYAHATWMYTIHEPVGNRSVFRIFHTNATGALLAGPVLDLAGGYLVSKPWLDEAGSMFVVAYLLPPSVPGAGDPVEGSTYALVRVRTPNVFQGPVYEWDAYFSPLLAYNHVGEDQTSGAQVIERPIPDRAAETGTTTAISVLLPCGTDVDPRSAFHPQSTYTFTPASTYGSADAVENFVFSAGAIVTYDGDRCFEATFPVRPFTAVFLGEVTFAGGGLVNGARYGWRQVFAYKDARGVLHRSAPSDALFHTMTTAGNAIGLDPGTPYYFTRRFNSADGPRPDVSVTIETYRTEANGATFYLESTVSPIQYVGVLSDEDLRTQPVLYTTAGALEHACPPPAHHAVLAMGRVFLLGTEDGNVWPSGTLLQGEAPWWNAVTSFPVPGLGPITGGAELDLSLIVFRENAIYAVTGDGPADTGDGGFQVQPIATDIGCIDARSIVNVPEGVLFQSRDGIAIVTRALSVERVGKPVELFLSGVTAEDSAGISAAVNVPTETEARFAVQRYDGAPKRTEAAVCYRLGGMGASAWSESTWSTHGIVGGMRIVSACLYANRFTWIADNGYVLQETPGAWLDGFTAEALPQYVPMTVWLAAWKPGPVQGWVRVWRVGLLGERKDAHDLLVELFHDYEDVPSTTRAWTGSEIASLPVEQLKVHVVKQKSEAIAVRVRDIAPTDAATVTGEGLVLAGVSLEMGLKAGMHRRPAVQKR